jgi:hypothetical protein
MRREESEEQERVERNKERLELERQERKKLPPAAPVPDPWPSWKKRK